MAGFQKSFEQPDETSDEWVAGALAPFGAVIGISPCGVPVYSSHYQSAKRSKYRDRGSYVHIDSDSGVYFGYKYQCVEFSRRWLVKALNCTFESIDMAYEAFDLPAFQLLPDMRNLPIQCVENGNGDARIRPAFGNVIIWNEGGFFRHTGHIGIITEATNTYVRVAEQNFDDLYWPQCQNYSRELPVSIDDATGAYTIIDAIEPHTSVRGWIRIILPENHSCLAKANTSLATSATSSSSSSSSSTNTTTTSTTTAIVGSGGGVGCASLSPPPANSSISTSPSNTSLQSYENVEKF